MNIDFARDKMIEQQVRAWDVLDEHVLRAMRVLPREHFVPARYAALAFADTEIPIGHGEYMMTPTVEGRVLQALELEGPESVLEVGTGSGFLTACLARLARNVTSVDIRGDFLATAGSRLSSEGIDNVLLDEMDAMQQLPAGPFDAIAVTGSVQRFDPRFVEVLKPGGRLFIVVGEHPIMDARRVIRTSDSEWTSESLFETELRPLVNGALPPQFEF